METYLPSHTAASGPLTLAPDGYVRLRLKDLGALSFFHLFSESDADFLEELQAQAIPASMAGFSEWRSDTEPALSLGWAWFVPNQSSQLLLAPERARSNLMLIDAAGYDLGSVKTSSLLRVWLNMFDWQSTVRAALQAMTSC